MSLPKLEKSLVDALTRRVQTILDVEGPFQIVVDDITYQAELRSHEGRKSLLSIYRMDSKMPQIHAEIKVSGVI